LHKKRKVSFLKYDISLLTVANPTFNICDISLWTYPLLQSFVLCLFSIVLVDLDSAVPYVSSNVPFSYALFRRLFHSDTMNIIYERWLYTFQSSFKLGLKQIAKIFYQDDTIKDVIYIITIPTIKPAIRDVFNQVFFLLSSTCILPPRMLMLSAIQEIIENTT
jgi:hypothetical protein